MACALASTRVPLWKVGVHAYHSQMKEEVMKEAHHSRFTVHPGETKMYHDLRRQYGWQGMKRDIAQFVSKCLTLTQVKVEHQKPVVLLQPYFYFYF